jgi:hypothetical protein
MSPSDLGKPVILSLPDGEVRGTLVGYVYQAVPTVEVSVSGQVFRNLHLDQVRLADAGPTMAGSTSSALA